MKRVDLSIDIKSLKFQMVANKETDYKYVEIKIYHPILPSRSCYSYEKQCMKDAGLQQTRVGESSVVGDSNSIFLKWKQNFEIK